MSSFMRFFRGANGEEEEEQQQQQQRPQRPGQPGQGSHSSSSSSIRAGPSSPPKAGGGQHGQQQPHNNKRAAHGHGGNKVGGPSASPSRGGGGGGSSSSSSSSSSNGADAGRKAAKTDGSMSPLSAVALKQLEGYSDQLDGLEDEVRAIESAIKDRRTPRARLLEAKDAVAQLNGSLEKLQFTGIDSVLTADLGEGKELAKEKRKSLNRRCDALRDRILKAGEALGRILATSP